MSACPSCGAPAFSSASRMVCVTVRRELETERKECELALESLDLEALFGPGYTRNGEFAAEDAIDAALKAIRARAKR